MHGDPNAPPISLPKPLSLSPRTFGMEDLRDFCGPLGSFKTGLTPRVFSTGLTPRSGFTPRFTTGFTPRVNTSGPPTHDTNSFFSRNTGFSPPRPSEGVNKISPTGFTPKDVTGMKVPMRFPGTFTNTPPKMEPHMPAHMQHHKPLHPTHPQSAPHHMGHMQPPPTQGHHMHHPEMNGHMGMPMFDYVNRPAISAPPSTSKVHKNVSPVSDKDPEEMDMDERRRMKNRERVRKCRKRKQDRLNYLEDRTSELEKENGVLRAKLARKNPEVSKEPLTEEQLNDLRKKQHTTLAAYISAYNESNNDSFENSARHIWSHNAEIIYGSNGAVLNGVNSIVANKLASSAVFGLYKIKNYTVEWKQGSNEKCLVRWEIDVSVKKDAPKDVPLTAPFADLTSFYGADEIIPVQMMSHLTFDDGKITEEIRQLCLSQMAASVMAKFSNEAGKAAEVLSCLMKA
ncbi:hypothetical protein PINS_up000097 [Pythium insidiosum]|nr:hypothetical protein PINS_up000097 [Pythium insidiosum]